MAKQKAKTKEQQIREVYCQEVNDKLKYLTDTQYVPDLEWYDRHMGWERYPNEKVTVRVGRKQKP